jgi:23S rRNA (pseudouridine1915-N3)-methyltransferase
MIWRVIMAGKPALAWARAGVDDYVRRLQRTARLEIESLREQPQATYGTRALAAAAGCKKIVLDERGAVLTTAEVVAVLTQ